MWAVEVVEVFPFLELVVEDFSGVDDDAVEESVEHFGVDSVGSFHLAVESWCSRFVVRVANAAVQAMPVEAAWKSDPLSVCTVSTSNGSLASTSR